MTERRRLPARGGGRPRRAGATTWAASCSGPAPTRRRSPTGSREAAGVDGFIGFAIGRTIFWEPLTQWLDGTIDADAAARAIADNYRRTIDVYTGAAHAV